jgi:hypothetical protein
MPGLTLGWVGQYIPQNVRIIMALLAGILFPVIAINGRILMRQTKLLWCLLTIIGLFTMVSCRSLETPSASSTSFIQPKETDLYSLIKNVNVSSGLGFSYEETPDDCLPEDVAMRIAQLFQAINNKEVNTLSSFFRDDAPYSLAILWRTEPEAEQLVFLDLKSLSDFLPSRYAQNETLTLTTVLLNFVDPERNQAHFLYHGYRTSDDLPDQKIFGKGVLYCESSTFQIIGIGPESVDTNGHG